MRANHRPDLTTDSHGSTAEIARLQGETVRNGKSKESELPPLPLGGLATMGEHHLLAAVGEAVLGVDATGHITFVNAAAEALLGWNAMELLGRLQHEILHHSLADSTRIPAEDCQVCRSLAVGQVQRSETEVFWRKDGTCFQVACTSAPVIEDGARAGALLLFRDISDRMRRETWEKNKNGILAAISSHRELESILQLIADAYVEYFRGCSLALLVQADQRLALIASAGLPPALKTSLASSETPESYREAAGFVRRRSLAASAPQPEMPRPQPPEPSLCNRAVQLGREVLATRNGGEGSTQEWAEFSQSAFHACMVVPLASHEGPVLGVVALFSAQEQLLGREAMAAVEGICDLARLAIEHQHLHREVQRQSNHDQLTGLPNRLLLEDRLERAVLHARRYGSQLAVACIDIDHFKQVNDTLGHAVGDTVLQHAAKLLRDSLREVDTVARQGGDEFLLILPDLKSEAEANAICARILSTLRQPIQVGTHTIQLTASMGRTVYPLDFETIADLLQDAEVALYAAKCAGRDRVEAFDASLGERHRRDIELQRELRLALENKEFHLEFQPLFNSSRELKAFETLLRWTHPKLGVISPGEFVPLAEKSGLIIPIGGWVLSEACRQTQEWSRLTSEPVKIFVNVSGVQLGEADFTETISNTLARTGLASNLLNLEITETNIVADTKAASIRLRQLRDLGVRISIDDFGCGHSSFSYLQQLPIDTIKIDRSFISGMDGTEKNSAIVRTIVVLAEELGLETIAEGIETELQFASVLPTRCNLFQGFLLSRPLSAEAAKLLLLKSRNRTEILPASTVLSRNDQAALSHL